MGYYIQHGCEPKAGPEPSYTHHPVDDIEPLPEKEMAGAQAALQRIIAWCLEAKTPMQLAQRAWIIGYCLYPHLVQGESLESMGRKTGVKRQRMHALRKEFSQVFSVRSPHQK